MLEIDLTPKARVAERRRLRCATLLLAVLALCASGCAAFPEVMHEPVVHNPFPQLYRVAVLPFYNQSAEATVDGEQVAIEYYTALQKIEGFEVMPVPVAVQRLRELRVSPQKTEDMQWIARQFNVDVLIAGSVTEYSAYYPPRIGLAVDWYAANPSYHPIPAGYGLPWGTGEEEFIPNDLKRKAEFELAREQLKTQTPLLPEDREYQPTRETGPQESETEKNFPEKNSPGNPQEDPSATSDEGRVVLAQHAARQSGAAAIAGDSSGGAGREGGGEFAGGAALPADWPDPRGFIPPPPSATRPNSLPSRQPIITHTKLYDGGSAEVTQAAQSYYKLLDDGRLGGWQSMLHRSGDYIKFCCTLHVYETLAARGGADESRLLLRWPIGR